MNQALNRLLQENKTAFYVFDIGKLKARIAHLQAALPPEVVLCYAVKANTFITKELIDTIHRFEVCSPGEAEICRAVGVPSENMVISGVYKTPEVMEAMVADLDFSPIYTVESLEQYELFRRLAQQYDRTLPLLLRLTNGSQFGINKGDIEAIVAQREETPEVDLLGIQFFSGTQKTSLKKLKREVGKLDDLLTLLEEKYGFVAQELEYGPGFPVNYFQSDELDEVELLAGFSELLHDMTHHPEDHLGAGAQHRRFLRHLLHPHCGLEAEPGAELRPGGRRDAPPGVFRPAHGHEAALFPCVRQGASAGHRSVEPLRIPVQHERCDDQAKPAARLGAGRRARF